MGRKSVKKRTKSEASPNTVSDQPDKRPTMSSSNPSPNPQATPQPFQHSNIQSPSGSFLSQISPYPGNCYASSPMQQYHQQQPNIPQYSQNPNSQSVPCAYNDQSLNKAILDRLDAMDSKLKKLDTIETRIKEMSQNLTNMDTRVKLLPTSDLRVGRKALRKACHTASKKKERAAFHLVYQLCSEVFTLEELAESRGLGLSKPEPGDENRPVLYTEKVQVLKEYVNTWCKKNLGWTFSSHDLNDGFTERTSYARKQLTGKKKNRNT